MSADPEFEVVGWPEAEPTLSLDYREFSYAGKFETSSTGKAVLRRRERAVGADDGEPFARDVLAAVAFDADRTDPSCLVVRYVTVRGDRRGEGLGPRLVTSLLERVAATGRHERARIAVNNPYAYEALYRAGFAYTGETTGIAELVLERPVNEPADAEERRYREGIDEFTERDLGDDERAFLERQRASGPPPVGTDDGPGAERGRRRRDR